MGLTGEISRLSFLWHKKGTLWWGFFVRRTLETLKLKLHPLSRRRVCRGITSANKMFIFGLNFYPGQCGLAWEGTRWTFFKVWAQNDDFFLPSLNVWNSGLTCSVPALPFTQSNTNWTIVAKDCKGLQTLNKQYAKISWRKYSLFAKW